MDQSKTKIQLTSSEIASVWTAYINDGMCHCIMTHFLETVENQAIREVIQYVDNLTISHLSFLKNLFTEENFPSPNGFTEEDVNLAAPRLYSDSFMLNYINHMARVGMLAYSGMMALSARKDIRSYFREALITTVDLYDLSADLLLEKGIFVRSPFIPYPEKTDFVDSESYLSGFSFFSKQRPLNTMEISYLYMNIQTNLIGSQLALSFAQASSREKIQEYMLRGKNISEKHIQIFTKELLENDVQTPTSSDVAITNSTVSPFSDKLMMFHIAFLSDAGIGNYATAAAASQRSDLVISYERLSLEIAQYAKDGATIMINNEWLEQPPGVLDKKKLVQDKKEGK